MTRSVSDRGQHGGPTVVDGPTTSDPATATFLLRAAVLAPSMHNTQPWRFAVRSPSGPGTSTRTVIEVHRDTERELPVEDPQRRAVHISIGTVLFNLRVAAAYERRRLYLRTFPDSAQPTMVALVEVAAANSLPATAEPARLAGLYGYLDQRRTNRLPFEDRPVAERIQQRLVAAAAREGATLEWVGHPYRRHRLLGLAGEAQYRDQNPQRSAERAAWVGGARDTDGVPSASLGPRSAERRAPIRDLAATPTDRRREQVRFEAVPAVAVLSTGADLPPDWVVAGQALQRVLLLGCAYGLAASLLNQALEYPELRWLVRDPASAWAVPQAVLRIGYGPRVPATPRRPLADFLIPADPIPDDRSEGLLQ